MILFVAATLAFSLLASAQPLRFEPRQFHKAKPGCVTGCP
jgi:hypothetical protein